MCHISRSKGYRNTCARELVDAIVIGYNYTEMLRYYEDKAEYWKNEGYNMTSWRRDPRIQIHHASNSDTF